MNKGKLTFTTLTAVMLFSFQAWAAKLNIAMPYFKQHTTLINKGPHYPNVIDALSSNGVTKSDGLTNEGSEGGNDDPIDEIIKSAGSLGSDTLNIENDGRIIIYHDLGFGTADLSQCTLKFGKIIKSGGINNVACYIYNTEGAIIGVLVREYKRPNYIEQKDITKEKRKKRRDAYLASKGVKK